MFTLDNTEGFNQETLDKMNAELEAELEAISDEEERRLLAKGISDKVFNKYC